MKTIFSSLFRKTSPVMWGGVVHLTAFFAFNNAMVHAQSGQKHAVNGNYYQNGDFLGSLNNTPLIIKTNNTEWIRITPTGNVGVGTSAPGYGYKMDIAGRTHGFGFYADSTMMALEVRAQLIRAGYVLADSAGMSKIVSAIIYATKLYGVDIYASRIDVIRLSADTITSSTGTVQFVNNNLNTSGTISAGNVSASALQVSGTTTLNTVVLNDGITIIPFIGTGEGLLKFNNTGGLNRLNFTSDSNDVLSGTGSFTSISGLIDPYITPLLGWQWQDSDLVATGNDVYISNSLYVGNTLSIGPFKIKNGGTRDTIRTTAALAIISDAQNINLGADTVRMSKYVEAPNIRSTQLQVAGDATISNNLSVGGKIDVGTGTEIISNGSAIDTLRTSKELSVISDAQVIEMIADTVRMKEYTRVGSDTSKYAPPVTGKLALEVAGSATVKGDVAVKGSIASSAIATNDLTISSTISSPKIITSRITSPDSLLYFGDSTLIIDVKYNSIYTAFKGSGNLYIQNQPWKVSNNTILNQNRGNVGIGTPTPTTKLDINGQLRMRTGAATGYVLVSDANGVGTWQAPTGMPDNDWALMDVTGGAGGTGDGIDDLSSMEPTGGKVIIGQELLTDASSHYTDYKMSVSGKLVAKKLISTEQNWQDDELKKNLTTEDLDKEEEFVKKESHLEGVPPGKEIEKDGLDLSAMSSIQMRKIEQVFLYLFNFGKIIRELRQENKHLKDKIDEMEKRIANLENGK